MLSARFKPWHVPLFLAKYAYLRARRRPVLVHFEVTMRCNARCNFCDYWKTDASAKEHELKSFADAARRFNPMMITFTGGEPTLRRDLEELVSAVNGAVRLKYVTLITHGGMLTPERAQSLWNAGINQFNISLDYLDARHLGPIGIRLEVRDHRQDVGRRNVEPTYPSDAADVFQAVFLVLARKAASVSA